MSVCPLIAVAFFAVAFFAVAFFAVAFFAVAFFAVAFFAVAFFAGTVYLPSDVVLSCPVITSLKAPRGKRPEGHVALPSAKVNPKRSAHPSTDRPKGALASQLARHLFVEL
jgi:hypothetical protein